MSEQDGKNGHWDQTGFGPQWRDDKPLQPPAAPKGQHYESNAWGKRLVKNEEKERPWHMEGRAGAGGHRVYDDVLSQQAAAPSIQTPATLANLAKANANISATQNGHQYDIGDVLNNFGGKAHKTAPRLASHHTKPHHHYLLASSQVGGDHAPHHVKDISHFHQQAGAQPGSRVTFQGETPAVHTAALKVSGAVCGTDRATYLPELRKHYTISDENKGQAETTLDAAGNLRLADASQLNGQWTAVHEYVLAKLAQNTTAFKPDEFKAWKAAAVADAQSMIHRGQNPMASLKDQKMDAVTASVLAKPADAAINTATNLGGAVPV